MDAIECYNKGKAMKEDMSSLDIMDATTTMMLIP